MFVLIVFVFFSSEFMVWKWLLDYKIYCEGKNVEVKYGKLELI